MFVLSLTESTTSNMSREEILELAEKRKPFIINFVSFIEDDNGERYDVTVTATAERPESGLLVINHYTSTLHRPLINQEEPVYSFEQMLEAAKESIRDKYNGEEIRFPY